ncbi:MAG: hypothetical protein HOP10_16315 [Chitinophagaceae bacterium]|nr:hypothetical protein [Chitinophagaceae bacterium]
MIKLHLIVIFAIIFQLSQTDEPAYRIVDKGVYIKLDKGETKKRFPFSENNDFYFSLKDDSTALIQDIKKGIPGDIIEYRIATKIDTAYVKHYATRDGKLKLNEIEKLPYKKVSPITGKAN